MRYEACYERGDYTVLWWNGGAVGKTKKMEKIGNRREISVYSTL